MLTIHERNLLTMYSDKELDLPERWFTGAEWADGRAEEVICADYEQALQRVVPPIAIGSGIVQNIVNVGQQPPAAAPASPPIVGNADLLITRLDLSDLGIDAQTGQNRGDSLICM